ncbi:MULTISPECIES: flavin-containing monooxygenase [Actinomadura]|uniref:Flavin-containing monooxygenase n=1 Tax=Actinomadura yumaensis TaxID=111807 RepID=A0ABW2CLP2_9ACTN|nr:NAD(P)/FAD-dependent oxidoreductase [Actinomadura sp. J1-007]MWK37900.1 NAD(P)-binding protein [Actinomadura sp. J1-007]
MDHEVAIVGAGFSGLGIAIELKRHGLDDFVIVDQRADIGGVWLANTYPGIAVDIPSASYSFSYEPNPDWSRVFAPGAELKRYADHCADKYGLRPHLRLGTRVERARWDEAARLWRLATPSGEITARFLITANGVLHQPKRPDIPGLDDFAGKVMHTAEWDASHDLSGRRVGLIGTGASALQVIPRIAAEVGRLHVYQRTAIWVAPKPDFRVPRPVRRLFRAVPATQRAVRAVTNAVVELFLVTGITQNRRYPFVVRVIERVCRAHLRRQVPDPELRRALTPTYGFGCKRPSMSSTYYPAFLRGNVELVTAGIERITPKGVRTADGREQEFDTLILGTGFKVIEPDNLPPYPITGRDGVDLGEHWARERYHAYEGTSVPQAPNLWMLMGPYSFTGYSWFGMIEYQSTHVLRCLTEARRRGATRVQVRQEADDRFFRDMLRRAKGTAFYNNNCASSNSYYFDASGDAPLLRPTSTLQALRRSRRFRLDDYSFTR